jgi:hypothetical protein
MGRDYSGRESPLKAAFEQFPHVGPASHCWRAKSQNRMTNSPAVQDTYLPAKPQYQAMVVHTGYERVF